MYCHIIYITEHRDTYILIYIKKRIIIEQIPDYNRKNNSTKTCGLRIEIGITDRTVFIEKNNNRIKRIIIYNDEEEESERHTHFFLLCFDFAICGEKGERRWRSQAALKVEISSGAEGGELERWHKQRRRWRA